MKRSLLLLQLFALLVAMSHWQAASAASGETRGAGYGFDSAKAYLETRSRDMSDFQSRFDNDVFQNLDAANAINLKYKTTPPEYVLYRLDLAKAIEGNAKKPEKLDALCRQFVAIDAAEKDYAAKIAAYNENLAEKFIPRDQYQLMDDDALREVLVTYLAGNSMIYGFNNPESLRMRIDKAVPYKTEDGDFGVTYFVRIGDRDSADDADSDRLYQVAYVNGDIASFDPVADDAADLAVLKVCGKTQ